MHIREFQFTQFKVANHYSKLVTECHNNAQLAKDSLNVNLQLKFKWKYQKHKTAGLASFKKNISKLAKKSKYFLGHMDKLNFL